ncbi:uncharacterized protein isoform X3 [Choristoneura fumiferana]|uniref:uncharacterized protein isoform X3 n=1 Tax=Choristoneura fumiferana TaxID=7141 RepID=UPI003D15396A
MKCIIFCLVLAVAAASPVGSMAMFPHGPPTRTTTGKSDDQDARRRLQALQLTLLNDIDDNKQSPNSGSVSDSKPAQTAQQYDGSEVVIGGHDHEATSTSRDTLQRGQKLNELASVLDYLTKRYKGRGVLKVAYNPATKSSNNPRIYKLGALRFTYIAPKDYDKSDDQTSYYTSPYLSNLKAGKYASTDKKLTKSKSAVHKVYLPQFVNKETQHDNYQHLLLNSQKTLPSNRYPARQSLRLDDDRDNDDDREDDDRQDDDREDDDREDDDREDDDREDDDRQDDRDDDLDDDNRQDDDRDDDDQDK